MKLAGLYPGIKEYDSTGYALMLIVISLVSNMVPCITIPPRPHWDSNTVFRLGYQGFKTFKSLMISKWFTQGACIFRGGYQITNHNVCTKA